MYSWPGVVHALHAMQPITVIVSYCKALLALFRIVRSGRHVAAGQHYHLNIPYVCTCSDLVSKPNLKSLDHTDCRP
jgi:hypothetical protein